MARCRQIYNKFDYILYVWAISSFILLELYLINEPLNICQCYHVILMHVSGAGPSYTSQPGSGEHGHQAVRGF